MNKEQFIKRLEEVGFEEYLEGLDYELQLDDVPNLSQFGVVRCYRIKIVENTNNEEFFVVNCHDLYSFDELEQFLLDKGIIEPKFDAHTYLLSKGYSKDREGYHHPSASYKICIQDNATEVSRTYRDENTWSFEGNSKESCDKAMVLIKCLEGIE